MAKKTSKTETFVLDCSVVLSWFFDDEKDDYADAVHDRMTSASAVVPQIWRLEVANAMIVGERRKPTTEAKITEFLALLKLLPILVDDQTTTRAWEESIHLARAHVLSVYDAAYLELAIRLGASLASIDGPLKAAAKATGVAEFKP